MSEYLRALDREELNLGEAMTLHRKVFGDSSSNQYSGSDTTDASFVFVLSLYAASPESLDGTGVDEDVITEYKNFYLRFLSDLEQKTIVDLDIDGMKHLLLSIDRASIADGTVLEEYSLTSYHSKKVLSNLASLHLLKAECPSVLEGLNVRAKIAINRVVEPFYINLFENENWVVFE